VYAVAVLPFASCAVIVMVWDPPAVCVPVPVTWNCVAVPAVKVTDAVCVINVDEDVEPSRARTVTDPAVVDVTVAVATPDPFVVHGPVLNVPVPDEISK